MQQIYDPNEPTYEDVLKENGRLRGRLAIRSVPPTLPKAMVRTGMI